MKLSSNILALACAGAFTQSKNATHVQQPPYSAVVAQVVRQAVPTADQNAITRSILIYLAKLEKSNRSSIYPRSDALKIYVQSPQALEGTLIFQTPGFEHTVHIAESVTATREGPIVIPELIVHSEERWGYLWSLCATSFTKCLKKIAEQLDADEEI